MAVVIIIVLAFQAQQSGNPSLNTNDNTNTLASTLPAGWKQYDDATTSLSFQYPEQFGANVWRPQFWPPKVIVIPGTLDPLLNGCQTDLEEKPVEQTKTLAGTTYTEWTSSGIGAGSLYNSYCYVATKNDKNYIFSFLIQSHSGCGDGNCGAYCGTPNETECKNLDRHAAYEQPIDDIVATAKF